MLHPNDALVVAVIGQALEIAELGGLFAEITFALGKQELANGWTFRIGLFVVVASLPVTGQPVFVEMGVLVAISLGAERPDIGHHVALPHRPIRGQVDTPNTRTVADHAGLRAVITLAKPHSVHFVNRGNRQKPYWSRVLKKDLVVDRDAVIQGAVAVEIVEPIDGAGIALDAELAAIDANLDQGRIATLMLPARGCIAEGFAGSPVVVADARI
ncbi:hypothetical protein CDG41_16420 [Pseudomonas aeruginosa]|nr:hypothetical protein CDG41_16420 [Pseudomonas aeruginosa]